MNDGSGSGRSCDSEESGTNDELQAAIRSVMLVKLVLSELLRSYAKNKKPLISSNCIYRL